MGALEEAYLSLEEPPRSDHLWRYTPWRRVHPTGDPNEIPSGISTPEISLTMLDGQEISGITIETENEISAPFDGSPTSISFLRAITNGKAIHVRIPDNWRSKVPMILDIKPTGGLEAAHIHIEAGKFSEATLLTRVQGGFEWLGLLRTGVTGGGSHLSDVLVNKSQGGPLVRVDALRLGRDSSLTAGTVSAGSASTKADIRYLLDSPGANLSVLGSLLSTGEMQLDHHIEINHIASNTFSRLGWHTACGGHSTSVGTGMLRIEKGAKQADAGQVFHNLLLSEKARANSIPELEVEENDVVGCGHGTANGPVDESQRFYLMARGLSEKEAEDALVAAFLNSTLSEMGSDEVHQWLIEAVEDALSDL